jgi:hypothetical protein
MALREYPPVPAPKPDRQARVASAVIGALVFTAFALASVVLWLTGSPAYPLSTVAVAPPLNAATIGRGVLYVIGAAVVGALLGWRRGGSPTMTALYLYLQTALSRLVQRGKR